MHLQEFFEGELEQVYKTDEVEISQIESYPK